MPKTTAYIGADPGLIEQEAYDTLVSNLNLVLRELVPAAFNTKQAPLLPGSIDFLPQMVSPGGLSADVLIDIEAYDTKDRRKGLNKRARKIRVALEEIFPDVSFAVWPKLVIAGWAAPESDEPFDGSMKFKDAVERAKDAIGFKALLDEAPTASL